MVVPHRRGDGHSSSSTIGIDDEVVDTPVENPDVTPHQLFVSGLERAVIDKTK